MNDKYYVVAGTKAEYDQFIRRKCAEMIMLNPHHTVSLSNFVFVDDEQKLRGLRGVHGWFVGSFRDRIDIRGIVRMIRWCNGIPDNISVIPDLYVGRGIV